MTMRPEDIKNRTFANALRGYDKGEVRSFLLRVSESSRELHEQLTATEAQLAAAATAAVEDIDENDDDFAADWVSPLATDVPPALAGLPTETPEAAAADADVTETFAVESVDASPGAPIVDESVPAAESFVEAPTASLAAAEQSIADRYGAIGDRIADLLRNADESAAEILTAAENDSATIRAAAEAEAAQVRTEAEERASQLLAEAQTIRAEADTYRDEVMAELANARLDQESALQEARNTAEAEVEIFRVDSIAEITALRSDAFVEIDELRSGANTEVAELRSVAQTEAEAMRESVLADVTASIAEDEAQAARSREEAEADRAAARSELDDVRSEVSSLLEQARTQSEFIKQEADEIIRTKVRANFEQAQTRIDVLRNTEVASRERIVLAQTELTSALTRLDSEPLPELDPFDSPAVIEEAVARHEELASGSQTFEVEAGSPDAGSADLVDDASSETSFGESVFEADIATASQELEEDSLSNYFGPGDVDESQTTGDILAGSFADPDDVDPDEPSAASSAADWPTTEVNEVEFVDVESVEYAPADEQTSDDAAFGAEQSEAPEEPTNTFGDFDVTEHVVVESADSGELPHRGSPDDLPVRGQTPTETDPFSAPESFGAASLSDALPAEADAPELGGATQEDALARLVREAMQEAVDSARKND